MSDYYIVPPEFLFAQMAETMDFLSLLLVGFELCGTYFSNLQFDTTLEKFDTPLRRKPFTNKRKIKNFLYSDVASGMKGNAFAKQTAEFILDNSDSPRESALAISLTLPRRLGGYALPQPQLNRRINISQSNSRLIRKSHFKCDLFWEENNLAIEYDSDLHHTGTQKIAQDSSRRDALAFLGVHVITVTNKQFANMQEMDKIAYTISKILGIRRRNEKRYNYQTRKIRLLQQLQ